MQILLWSYFCRTLKDKMTVERFCFRFQFDADNESNRRQRVIFAVEADDSIASHVCIFVGQQLRTWR